MARPEPHPPEVMGILAHKDPSTRIAVVGASNAVEKYGNIIVKNLMRKGYTILPVNPHEDEIAGLKTYAKLADIDPPPDLVNIVTPPEVTREILEQAAQLGLKAVWMQDGSFDEEILDRLAGYPFETVYDACIMVVSNYA